MAGRILLVDDEEQLRKLLARVISLEGFTVVEAADLKTARLRLQDNHFDVLLCDVRLPDGNGVAFTKEVKLTHPELAIVLLTAHGNIADGVQAMKNGAFDYLVKGDDNDRVIPLMYQAVDMTASIRKRAVRVVSPGKGDGFESVLGTSTAIRASIEQARKIAASTSTVLLLGETGTGKEVFAHAIHNAGARRDHPFIAVNCSAFSRELLEGELFGYKEGAYTGAKKDKAGLVEVAKGGTLFLDEIGELHPDLQAKLLRVLENGEFIKLGDTKVSKADVRIIAATNRHLPDEIEAGRFREDLFYRLNVFAIELPALRHRRDDIPLLVDFFLQQFITQLQLPPIRVAPAAMQLLKQYSWKGNIRELKNVIERAIFLRDDDQIQPQHLPYDIQEANAAETGLSLAAVEAQHIRRILQTTNWNKTRAAKLLQIGLATLYRKMQDYDIEPPLSK